MPPLRYRCPNTGLNAQGVADDPTDDESDPIDNESYAPVTCIACTRTHLVNPKTGKVLGVDED